MGLVFSQTSELQYLDLSDNFLNSSIHYELGLCTNLTYLSLSYNKLNGELPNLKNLVRLFLANNIFIGQILPSLVSNWIELVSLYLQNNEFREYLANGMGDLISLSTLNLSRNHLTGKIPQSLGKLTQLQELDLSYNHMVGEITQSLGNSFQLQFLDLSANNSTGVIPLSKGLIGLVYMDLSSNSLSGAIPSKLPMLTRLEVTDKCDVYSFGVVALEVMMGRHSSDMLESELLESSTSMKGNADLLLKDAMVLVMSIALACIRTRLGLCPTMHFVSQNLLAQSLPCLPEPFGVLTINKLSPLQN
ncbi:leucine-rich repeat receptor-like protein kinase [Pyrus ussuriensis x Pyrus communis]|uniref:Leucine-rich repeat receptor-like protein kinase n=1 Tax=Pyrus ussuriensis x Pyrus communis TaxID=2448454 RepID=A0A5N5I8B4_9ROSA|nr:leucine-rich repeat receptor-like protein kinase [Pyrus ussuriensis x Pyrus communis]